MPGGSWRFAALLFVCLATLSGTGCGDDEDSAVKRPTAFSKAAESPRAFALRMAKLLETTGTPKECQQLAEINGRSRVRFACPPSKKLRRSMSRFEIVGAEEYGTGAVVDYTSGDTPDGAAIVLFVATDRKWGISRLGVITEPSTKASDDQSRSGFRKAVDDYLTAVRERDCKAFADVAFTGGASEAKVCRVFPSTNVFAKRLKTNPAATPKYEGGNGTYGFFSLETEKPTRVNETISVVKASAGSASPYMVLDVAPSPTSVQQRATIELYQQQGTTEDDEPTTSPSRKAD